MIKENNKIQQNEADNQVKVGVSQGSNSCCNCNEGYILGEKVYCNINGRFHPLRDNNICKNFISKSAMEQKGGLPND